MCSLVTFQIKDTVLFAALFIDNPLVPSYCVCVPFTLVTATGMVLGSNAYMLHVVDVNDLLTMPGVGTHTLLAWFTLQLYPAYAQIQLLREWGDCPLVHGRSHSANITRSSGLESVLTIFYLNCASRWQKLNTDELRARLTTFHKWMNWLKPSAQKQGNSLTSSVPSWREMDMRTGQGGWEEKIVETKVILIKLVVHNSTNYALWLTWVICRIRT